MSGIDRCTASPLMRADTLQDQLDAKQAVIYHIVAKSCSIRWTVVRFRATIKSKIDLFQPPTASPAGVQSKSFNSLLRASITRIVMNTYCWCRCG
jgi:hypothetical protein